MGLKEILFTFDFRVFLCVFGALFVVELGDKTQLAVLCFSTSTKSPLSVFAGASAALIVSSFIAVIAGVFIQKLGGGVLAWVRGGSGVLFIIIGIWVLYSAITTKGQL